MTEEELTAIEARATAATREPWSVGDAYVPTASLSAVSVYGMGMEIAECQTATDGAFIAAARVDVPSLVAEVRRLRALVKAAYAEGWAASSDCSCDACIKEGEPEWLRSDARKALVGG